MREKSFIEIKSTLNMEDQLLIKQLQSSVSNIPIAQAIEFPHHINNESRLNYILLYKNNKTLLGYCLVIESHSRKLPFIKTAKIFNGPIVISVDDQFEFINTIYKHYRKKKFTSLSIQTGIEENSESHFLNDKLINDLSFKYIKGSNKNCTLQVELDKTIDDIYADFKKVLKKNIKSAINKNVVVELVETESDVIKFSKIYKKMCEERNIHLYSQESIINICLTIIKSKKGFVLKGVYEGNIIGGGIFVDEGSKITYLCGASDSEYRKIPTNHLVLFEAIKESKKKNKQFFDLGGIDFFAKENSPKYFINQFKLGFSSSYVFYSPEIEITYNRLYHFLYDIVIFIKERVIKK